MFAKSVLIDLVIRFRALFDIFTGDAWVQLIVDNREFLFASLKHKVFVFVHLLLRYVMILI